MHHSKSLLHKSRVPDWTIQKYNISTLIHHYLLSIMVYFLIVYCSGVLLKGKRKMMRDKL